MGFWSALLGRVAPEVKESRTGPVVSMWNVGRPVHTPRDYESFAKEGYERNIVVYRCISLIAESVATIPWRLYRGDREVVDHPVLEILERPNPLQSRTEFLEASASYDLLAGNLYWERAVAGRSAELYVLRPDRMKVIPGPRGWPEAFQYAAGGRKVRYEVDLDGTSDVLHLKRFHPRNDWYGMSPLEAAAYAADQHNAAGKWNLGLLQNGARPSGALKYSPREGDQPHMPEDQFRRLRATLDEQGAKSNRTGRPLLLEGQLEWVQMMLSALEMDWIGGIKLSASQIAQAFQVPEQLVGVEGQQTYNNWREARLALYEDAVMPLARKLAEALTHWFLVPFVGEGYELVVDDDDVPALAVRKELQWDRVGNAPFLTINEKREALGYEPIDGGDTLFVPAGQLPVDFVADPPELVPTERAAEAAYGRKA
ncbi:MAG: phage portal protein [Pseudomonadales bacterium]|jgi:HK97 family phage portal protein|nr:phage portal protein [Pseudomonadales bacterium]